MARPRRSRCRICGGHVADVGPLSARGKCATCGDGRMLQNRRELMAHTGQAVHEWRRAMAASVGAVLVDELERDAAGG